MMPGLKKVKKHEEFNEKLFSGTDKQRCVKLRCFIHCSEFINDIALIRLTTPATMSDTVGSICLTKMTIHDNSEAIATGWGGTDESNTQSSVLKKVSPFIHMSRKIMHAINACALLEKRQPSLQAAMKVKDKILGALKCGGLGGGNVLCATFKDGKICAGDSGGPLVADLNGDGRWVLYGVTSFGKILCIDILGGSGFSDVAAWTDTIIGVVNANP